MILIVIGLIAGISLAIIGTELYKIASSFTWNPADEFLIEDLLARYEKLEEFKSGILTCNFCGESLSHLNMGPIVESEDRTQLDLICNNSECIIGYFDLQENTND